MGEETFKITIDGREVEGRAGETLLEVCRRAGKDIPTLCHHPALKPYASCRVCLVEVSGPGVRPGLVPSCQFPASGGLTVGTSSSSVESARRTVLELLLARCPKSDVIRSLAARYGVTETPYSSDDSEETCILCGLCVRVCEELVGQSAVGFAQRGIDRRVGSPFDESSEVCIGCGACVNVCPTGHVKAEIEGRTLHMKTWRTDLPLVACECCGAPFAPARLVERVGHDRGENEVDLRVCPRCRAKETGRKWAQAAKAEAARGLKG